MNVHIRSQYSRRYERQNSQTEQADGSGDQRDLIDALLLEQLPALQRYARRLARDPGSAEDLVQDTCLRILTRSSQFQPGTSFKGWAIRIMQTIWRNQLRYDGRRTTSSLDVTQDLADPRSSRAEDHVELTQVAEAAERLIPCRRHVLHLVAFKGLSYREAAEVSGAPLGTVMSRLSRARSDLAEFVSSP